MNDQLVPADIGILDLLRKRDALSVAELAAAMEVTATAVRQRLNRLMAQGYIARYSQRAGRGRPGHRYQLTAEGRRKTGANFADLAVALWEEIREVKDPEVRRGLLQRISARMAKLYEPQVSGETTEERMDAVSEVFSKRRIPFAVERQGRLPVLQALACPYPDLAEVDRGVCAMELMMLSELVGDDLRLSECRLDGDNCCSFQVASPS